MWYCTSVGTSSAVLSAEPTCPWTALYWRELDWMNTPRSIRLYEGRTGGGNREGGREGGRGKATEGGREGGREGGEREGREGGREGEKEGEGRRK